MLKLDLENSKQKKLRWTDIIKPENPHLNKNKKKNKIIKLVQKSLVQKKILYFLTTTLAIVSIVSIYVIKDISDNPVNYGLIRPQIEVNNEGSKYYLQLIEQMQNSKNLDVRSISDIELIRQNNPEAAEFFANAQNGDILIINIDIGGAFIFRPRDKTIINFSKISLEQENR